MARGEGEGGRSPPLARVEEVLAELLGARRTGELRVSRGAMSWSFFVDGGEVVQADSGGGGSLAKEMAALCVREACLAKQATWKFVDGARARTRASLDVRPILFAIVRDTRDATGLRSDLDRALAGGLRVTGDLSALGIEPALKNHLRLLDGTRPAKEAVDTAPGAPGAAAAAVWLGMALGLVERVPLPDARPVPGFATAPRAQTRGGRVWTEAAPPEEEPEFVGVPGRTGPGRDTGKDGAPPPPPLSPPVRTTGQVSLKTALLFALFLATAALWTQRHLFQDEEEELPNLAPGYTQMVPLRSLVKGERGYLGIAESSWEGLADATRARSDCEALVVVLAPEAGLPVVLADPTGLPVVTCGAP